MARDKGRGTRRDELDELRRARARADAARAARTERRATDQAATTWAAPRSVFIPPALQEKSQPKKGRGNGKPFTDHDAAVTRPVRLGPQPRNVTDAVPPLPTPTTRRAANPYRPTQREQRAAIAELGALSAEARRSPSPLGDAAMRVMRLAAEQHPAALPFVIARDARDLPNVLQDPSASRREKLEAAGNITAVAGLPGMFRGRPKTKPDVAPEPIVQGADKIVGSLDEAKKLRLKQEKLYRQERGKRGAKAETAAEIGGQEGYHAALAELKGDLPKLKFGALDGQMDQPTVDKLFTHIQRLDDLRPFEKISAQRALTNALEGRVPTRGDIKMLARVFGPDAASQIQGSIPFWAKAKNVGLNVINVPRSIMASADLSAPFRQGLVLGARHPKMWASEIRPMLKSFKSERVYDDVMDEISSRPTFGQMQKARLQLTDLGAMSNREDQFMSNYAEHIPAVGRVVRASGRAYTAFLNKFRADAFDNYLRLAEEQGLDIADEQLLKDIASWVNHATGRGSIKYFEGSMVPLTAALFSPRLMASRLQLLNPVYYGSLSPFARKQALQGAASTLGAVSLTLYLAKLAGAEVGLDPRSADFGKIKVGDTRVDVSGGFQSYLVAAWRLVKGESVSSVTGEVKKLEGGFANPSRWSLLGDFFENKTAPVLGTAIDWGKNENFDGEPFKAQRDIPTILMPFGVSTAIDGYKAGGAGAAAAAVGLGGVGFGVQTYGLKPPRGAKKQYDEQLKEIDAAERRGQIDGDTADTLRQQAYVELETEMRERQLAGLNDEKKIERQLVIDDVVRQGGDIEMANSYLSALGMEPATQDELDETEEALLALTANLPMSTRR